MPEPNEPNQSKDTARARLDEARHLIEEYAADIREIIRLLARKLN